MDRQEFDKSYDEESDAPEEIDVIKKVDRQEFDKSYVEVPDAPEEIQAKAEKFIEASKKKGLQRMEESNRDRSPKLESAEEDLTEEEVKQVFHHGDTSSNSTSSSPCIFRTPFPRLQFQEPQLASIGPYHRSKNLPLEKYKYSFLEKFISRTRNQGKDLCFYVQQMMSLEWRTRKCYSEDLAMSSPEFVEMMLVDGCFIMEVLRHFGNSGESEDWFFPIEPWQLPILVQDLLMLENQIPFFVLEKLFDLLESEEGTATVSLPTMALKFFDLAFPRSMDIGCKFNHLKANHLLDLFLETIRPSKKAEDILSETPATNPKLKEDLSPMHSEPSISKRVQHEQQCDPPPPLHSTKNVMELRTSGIELRAKRAARFTDINFKNGMLEIPPVIIDDLFIAILINCVAFEHSSKRSSKDLSAYVSFMSRLIRHPTDAELLCSNGIISRFSHNDQKVVKSFHLLWINIFDLDIQDSYLFKRLKEIECYYKGGKTWYWWHYALSYWRISLFCITNLLFAFNRLRTGVNLMIHFVQEVKIHGVYADFLGDSICVLSQGHSSFICNSVLHIVRFIYNSARGRVKSLDLGLRKFMVFCFLNLIIVIIILMVCEIHAPTQSVDKQDVEVEVSVTVEKQDVEVEDSVTVDKQDVEAEDLLTVDKQDVEVEDSLTVDKQDVESEDSLTVDKQDVEAEDSLTVDKQDVEDEDSLNRREQSAMETNWSSVDCMDNEEYYNEPWRKLLEHQVFPMLVWALRVT